MARKRILMTEVKVDGLRRDNGVEDDRQAGDAAGAEVVGELEKVDPSGHQKGAQGEQGELAQGLLDALHGKSLLSERF